MKREDNYRISMDIGDSKGDWSVSTIRFVGCGRYLEERWGREDAMRDIKLLVWDVDETIWNGTWIYDGEEVYVKPEIFRVMKGLDDRGILQSIVTRNADANGVTDRLQREGIWEYLLYPQIANQPKSIGLLAIKNALGLSRWDEIALIDDNEFERKEVTFQYPEIRTISADVYRDLLGFRGFKRSVITDIDRRRRELYQDMEQRHVIAEAYDGDYQAFLKSLNMKATIRIMGEGDVARVHQLMERTNRFNSAVRVLSVDELMTMMSEEIIYGWVMELTDDIGDYGIIGYKIINRDSPSDYGTITDMTVSCRVAGRGLGSALVIHSMKAAENQPSVHGLMARFKETKHNSALHKLYQFLGFQSGLCIGDESVYIYRWLTGGEIPDYADWLTVVSVEGNVEDWSYVEELE